MWDVASRWAALRRAGSNRSGAAALEFAIVGPAFVLVLLGLTAYGGYFWLSHMVQEVTNDAARAAIAGLTSSERTQLAQSQVTSELQTYTYLQPNLTAVTTSGNSQILTVTVAYDATNTPFWALSPLVPMPSQTITRSATIKLGGF